MPQFTNINEKALAALRMQRKESDAKAVQEHAAAHAENKEVAKPAAATSVGSGASNAPCSAPAPVSSDTPAPSGGINKEQVGITKEQVAAAKRRLAEEEAKIARDRAAADARKKTAAKGKARASSQSSEACQEPAAATSVSSGTCDAPCPVTPSAASDASKSLATSSRRIAMNDEKLAALRKKMAASDAEAARDRAAARSKKMAADKGKARAHSQSSEACQEPAAATSVSSGTCDAPCPVTPSAASDASKSLATSSRRIAMNDEKLAALRKKMAASDAEAARDRAAARSKEMAADKGKARASSQSSEACQEPAAATSVSSGTCDAPCSVTPSAASDASKSWDTPRRPIAMNDEKLAALRKKMAASEAEAARDRAAARSKETAADKGKARAHSQSSEARQEPAAATSVSPGPSHSPCSSPPSRSSDAPESTDTPGSADGMTKEKLAALQMKKEQEMAKARVFCQEFMARGPAAATSASPGPSRTRRSAARSGASNAPESSNTPGSPDEKTKETLAPLRMKNEKEKAKARIFGQDFMARRRPAAATSASPGPSYTRRSAAPSGASDASESWDTPGPPDAMNDEKLAALKKKMAENDAEAASAAANVKEWAATKARAKEYCLKKKTATSNAEAARDRVTADTKEKAATKGKARAHSQSSEPRHEPAAARSFSPGPSETPCSSPPLGSSDAPESSDTPGSPDRMTEKKLASLRASKAKAKIFCQDVRARRGAAAATSASPGPSNTRCSPASPDASGGPSTSDTPRSPAPCEASDESDEEKFASLRKMFAESNSEFAQNHAAAKAEETAAAKARAKEYCQSSKTPQEPAAATSVSPGPSDTPGSPTPSELFIKILDAPCPARLGCGTSGRPDYVSPTPCEVSDAPGSPGSPVRSVGSGSEVGSGTPDLESPSPVATSASCVASASPASSPSTLFPETVFTRPNPFALPPGSFPSRQDNPFVSRPDNPFVSRPDNPFVSREDHPFVSRAVNPFLRSPYVVLSRPDCPFPPAPSSEYTSVEIADSSPPGSDFDPDAGTDPDWAKSHGVEVREPALLGLFPPQFHEGVEVSIKMVLGGTYDQAVINEECPDNPYTPQVVSLQTLEASFRRKGKSPAHAATFVPSPANLSMHADGLVPAPGAALPGASSPAVARPARRLSVDDIFYVPENTRNTGSAGVSFASSAPASTVTPVVENPVAPAPVSPLLAARPFVHEPVMHVKRKKNGMLAASYASRAPAALVTPVVEYPVAPALVAAPDVEMTPAPALFDLSPAPSVSEPAASPAALAMPEVPVSSLWRPCAESQPVASPPLAAAPVWSVSPELAVVAPLRQSPVVSLAPVSSALVLAPLSSDIVPATPLPVSASFSGHRVPVLPLSAGRPSRGALTSRFASLPPRQSIMGDPLRAPRHVASEAAVVPSSVAETCPVAEKKPVDRRSLVLESAAEKEARQARMRQNLREKEGKKNAWKKVSHLIP
ncbi:hypothetical protein EDC01DRAFT_634091 [Geopyxis carbonaria]|nr:hypothetical protein EDC01DRAFT_634091 [Geopyxis carbonaria]